MKRMLIRKPLSKMTGLTLLETMFALAVGALVLIGAVIFYMSTKQNANTSKTVGDMNAIVSAYQSYVAGGNTLTTSIGIKQLQTDGYLPQSGATADGNMYNAWGLAYGVKVASLTPTTTITIDVTGVKVGDKNCNTITTAVGSGATVATSGACVFTYTL